MSKVCIVTGTRAEYGILKPLIERFHKDLETELQIVATGMHLSPEFGLTYKQIEEDGYFINEKIENVLSSDTKTGVTKSIGLGMISFADAFERLKPDIVIVLGDRYEIFAVATAAFVAHIPIAHIHGGETTEGATDEGFRHSITKMSYLHFASTETYRKRIIQLGESPDRVFNVGAMGVENVKKVPLLTKEEIETQLECSFNKPVALVTYHPVTLENQTAIKQINELFKALDAYPDLNVIFTRANSDAEGRVINREIDKYVAKNPQKAKVFASLGMKRYLSAVKYSQMVIGNSSSAIIEVPSLKVPAINIGDRQKGRIHNISVIDCKTESKDIIGAISKAQDKEFQEKVKNADNPYEGNETSKKIYSTIKSF